MSATTKARPLFDLPIVRRALVDSFRKLNPRHQLRNPVMFTVFVGSILTTGLGVHALITPLPTATDALSAWLQSPAFILVTSAWLWFTVLFANFAEAMAEARGKAQADALRKTKTDVLAKKMTSSGKIEEVSGSILRSGDVVAIMSNGGFGGIHDKILSALQSI